MVSDFSPYLRSLKARFPFKVLAVYIVPQVIEAVLAQSKAKETPPPYTPLQRVSHGSLPRLVWKCAPPLPLLPRTVASLDNSSVVGSSVVSPVTSPVVSPRPGDLNMALTVAESVLGGRSPSLRY